jgi:hypothetical protein
MLSIDEWRIIRLCTALWLGRDLDGSAQNNVSLEFRVTHDKVAPIVVPEALSQRSPSYHIESKHCSH